MALNSSLLNDPQEKVTLHMSIQYPKLWIFAAEILGHNVEPYQKNLVKNIITFHDNNEIL